MTVTQKGFDFRRMRFLINRLPMAQFRVMKAKSQAVRITPVLTGMPHAGGVSSPVENGYLLMEAAKDALDNIERELTALRQELAPHIETLTDPLEEQAMRMRYMEGRSVREIAYSLNYSERRIFQVISIAERRVGQSFH